MMIGKTIAASAAATVAVLAVLAASASSPAINTVALPAPQHVMVIDGPPWG